MNYSPQETIQKLINERYPEAGAVFWAGSLSQGEGTQISDLDLVIVCKKLNKAYREAFVYEGWSVDAFVHDRESISSIFEESRISSGIPATIQMVLTGKDMMPPCDFSNKIREEASYYLKQGPVSWDKARIDKERFFITDALDDILYPQSSDDQIATASWLFGVLSQFYLRAQNKWAASRKHIIPYLHKENPDLAREFLESFNNVFTKGDATCLKKLVDTLLEPYGGRLWNGYRSEINT